MDPTLIAPIAAATVKLLSPFFEEVIKGTGKVTGEAAAGGAMTKAQELYQVIRSRFAGKPMADAALADLDHSPDDPDRQAALRVQLKKVLETDGDFANELAKLLEEAEHAGANAVFNINITGEVRQLVNIARVYGNVSL